MNGDVGGDGQVSETIRRKIRSCRRALRVSTDNNTEQLAKATVVLFSIENEHLPEHLRPDLAKAKEVVLGNALTQDSDDSIAEGQVRRALSSLPRSEQMQLTYSLLAFCNRCETNPEG